MQVSQLGSELTSEQLKRLQLVQQRFNMQRSSTSLVSSELEDAKLYKRLAAASTVSCYCACGSFSACGVDEGLRRQLSSCFFEITVPPCMLVLVALAAHPLVDHCAESVACCTSQAATMCANFWMLLVFHCESQAIAADLVEGAAALVHAEMALINVACDDPGATVGLMLVRQPLTRTAVLYRLTALHPVQPFSAPLALVYCIRSA